MRTWRWVGVALALVVLVGLAIARPAPAAFRDCGVVRFSGTRTHIVVLRGTTCATAKRVARTYDRAFAPPASSNLASRTHAFVGTLP
jgi:hypothetical protein